MAFKVISARELAEKYVNDGETYSNVSEPLKAAVQKWVELVFQPAKGVMQASSYGLKHLFEHSLPNAHGLYMSNGEFIGAMIAAGYEPVETNHINKQFHIKVRSNIRAYSSKHRPDCHMKNSNACLCHITPDERAEYEQLVQAVEDYNHSKRGVKP